MGVVMTEDGFHFPPSAPIKIFSQRRSRFSENTHFMDEKHYGLGQLRKLLQDYTVLESGLNIWPDPRAIDVPASPVLIPTD